MKIKYLFKKASLTLTLTLALAYFFECNAGLYAQTTNSGSLIAQREIRYAPPPRPEDLDFFIRGRRPMATRGGACPIMDSRESLTALVPENSWGLTVSPYPTFWFYIPNSSNKILDAEFILRSHTRRIFFGRRILYKKKTKLPKTPGIVYIKTEYPLQIGKRYIWGLKVNCGSRDYLSHIFVQGIVERVRPNTYADNQIWHDLLTNIANRLDNPKDAKSRKDWMSLLIDVDLPDLAEKPLLPCCVSNK